MKTIAQTDLTMDRLHEFLNYDPETGLFTRKFGYGGCAAGAIAGSVNKNGYVYITICRKKYLAHRLAWLHTYGDWPKDQIDHIDGCRSNNRIFNLRDVVRSTNLQNLKRGRSDNKSGLLGVSWAKRDKKWVAQIKASDGHRFIGYFNDKNKAHEAYLSVKRKQHEGCTI